MRKASLLLALSLAFTAGTASAQKISAPPDLDTYVHDVLSAFEVPGIALTIVKDGQVVVARGYGVKQLGRSEAVDPNTLFGIASNTKAFTGTALALLVEEGKIEWDKPVVDYLPWFRLSDPFVTSQLTVRDLLVHRSGLGLGAGDLLWWPPSNYDRQEIARRLRHIPLATSFRSAYAYDNVLYLIAGEVIEAVSGRSWEDFVEQRILDRIGMQNAAVRHSAALQGGNVASTHARVEGKVRLIQPFGSDNTNPAGGIMAGAADMAKWLIVQLDSGRIAGRSERLFSPRTARELWTLVTPIPFGDPPAELAPQRRNFNGYGLGFFVTDYRGRKMLIHSGGLPGYISRVALIPDLKLGVSILTNHESPAMDPILYRVLDHYMKAPAHDWLAAYRARSARQDSVVAAMDRKAATARDSLSKPALPLAQYAGTYRDPWYGDVVIEQAGDGLRIRFVPTPSLVGELVHWQYDTFLARWKDRELRADAFATFTLNPDGTVKEMSIVPASESVDFSFDFQDLRLKRVE
jgi:CubicO group peptidase (beta-lactamase class C family)